MAVEGYELVKLVHVLAAFFLIGTIPFEYLLVLRARAQGDKAFLARLLANLEWVENRVAIPSAVVLLVSGLLMVYGPYGQWPLFDRNAPLATIGLVIFVLLILVFAVIVAGRFKKIRAWAEGTTTEAPPWRAWQAWMWTGMALALVVIFEMVTKAW